MWIISKFLIAEALKKKKKKQTLISKLTITTLNYKLKIEINDFKKLQYMKELSSFQNLYLLIYLIRIAYIAYKKAINHRAIYYTFTETTINENKLFRLQERSEVGYGFIGHG